MLGIKAGAFLTNHDNPYGRAIGNQIEIEETIECLHGNIPKDIEELVTVFGTVFGLYNDNFKKDF